MRELRHDFRAYYGVSYDEVGADEAIDLILTLPQGSLYMGSVSPEYKWSGDRQLLAEIADMVAGCMYALAGMECAPPRAILRPADIAAMKEQSEMAVSVRGKIKNTNWEEVG